MIKNYKFFNKVQKIRIKTNLASTSSNLFNYKLKKLLIYYFNIKTAKYINTVGLTTNRLWTAYFFKFKHNLLLSYVFKVYISNTLYKITTLTSKKYLKLYTTSSKIKNKAVIGANFSYFIKKNLLNFKTKKHHHREFSRRKLAQATETKQPTSSIYANLIKSLFKKDQVWISAQSLTPANIYNEFKPEILFFLKSFIKVNSKFFKRRLKHVNLELLILNLIFTLKFRTPKYLLGYIKNMITKITIREQFLFLYFLNNIIKTRLINILFLHFKVKGFYFKVKGKISAGGNARKKIYYIKKLRYSPTTTNLRLKKAYNQATPLNGVLGLNLIIAY